MKSRILSLLLLTLAILTLCGFTGQSTEERQAQKTLPKAQDQIWQLLGQTKVRYDEKKQRYNASIPADVKALAEQTVTVSGFMLPLEPTEKFRHFILSKRTPTCAFCLPGEPNEVIDVWLEKPTGWDEGLVKITGTFVLISDQDMGMFFQIKEGKKH